MADNEADALGTAGMEGMSEEDAAALADWGALEDLQPKPAVEESGSDTRVLNQDEIDSLLGFEDAGGGDGSATGIKAILDNALMAYEKLPMVEVVFDRMVRNLSTTLRNFTSDTVEVGIDSMKSLRFGDYLNSIPLPALLSVFKAVEWDNYGLITIDASLIYSIVDVLLGGGRSNRPVRIEGRPYTTIEQGIVEQTARLVLSDMGAAFDPLSPVTFQFDRMENNPRFATISRPANAALLVRLRVDMEERGGNIEILIPHATIEPIRDLLLQMFMGEKFGRDALWEGHLGKELSATQVNLEAVLPEKTISLRDVMHFRVGSTLVLDSKVDSDVMLRCGDVRVARGKIGSMEKKMAVRIEEALPEKYKLAS